MTDAPGNDNAKVQDLQKKRELNDAAKLELEQEKIEHDHTAKLGAIAADMFKSQTDRHVAHVQAATDLATAAMPPPPSNDNGSPS